MAFDTERAARRLTDGGLDERAANGVADVVGSATNGLATEASVTAVREDLLELKSEIRADLAALEARLYRALWVQGLGILAGLGAIVTIVSVLD